MNCGTEVGVVTREEPGTVVGTPVTVVAGEPVVMADGFVVTVGVLVESVMKYGGWVVVVMPEPELSVVGGVGTNEEFPGLVVGNVTVPVPVPVPVATEVSPVVVGTFELTVVLVGCEVVSEVSVEVGVVTIPGNVVVA